MVVLENRSLALKVLFSIIFVSLAAVPFYGVAVSGSLWTPHGDSSCSTAKPISLKIRNWTFRRVISTKIEVQLWGRDKSINLLQDVDNSGISLKYFISPMKTLRLCMSDSIFEDLRLKEVPPQEEGEYTSVMRDQLIRINYFISRYLNLVENTELKVTLLNYEH
jgi:hypothetical protein